MRAATGAAPPRLTVLVVDDAPTPAAAALRKHVAEDLESGLHQLVTNRWGSCYSNDPAEDHYTDERIVVVFPSAPGVATVSPATSPGLAWITNTTGHGEAQSLAEATEQALAARTAAPGEVYRPIRAATRTAQLVLGLRAPESDAENALLGSLEPSAWVRVLVASTRDDQGTDPIDDLVASWDAPAATEHLYETIVAGPFGTSEGSCHATTALGSTRLFAWASESGAAKLGWPCGATTGWLGEGVSCFCGDWCLSNPPLKSATGAVACRIWVDQRDLSRCDPSKGRTDPDGIPTWVAEWGTKYRRCELRQLEGAALEACRTTLACDGCPAGWCATEVPELLGDSCGSGMTPSPLRWIGSALGGADGVVVRCDVE